MIGGDLKKKRAQDEAFFREMYPGFPDDRTYALLATAVENQQAHPKELKSILKRKCKSLPSPSDQA